MGKPTGFLEHARRNPDKRPASERVGDYDEFESLLPETELRAQGSRCMDCGIPFCQADTGCPLGNLIPEWNHHVYRDEWDKASDRLHATNNFPEVTGRVCPAPCEAACTLNIHEIPVTVKQLERAIVDRAADEGWIQPRPPQSKTGKSVAIVGSGPAGLAAAQQLARVGHEVVVFEKADRPGGLLRYGIPDFKLSKALIDRRVVQMEAEGVVFRCGVNVGRDLSADELLAGYDAIVLALGAEHPRDLPVDGRELSGVHFAMDYLTQQNRRVAGDEIPAEQSIVAEGKRVVVLGGGDTGSDCVGTAHRQGATEVVNFELMPQLPDVRAPEQPWPWWPLVRSTSYAHEEGGTRDWSILTKRFIGDEDGQLTAIEAVGVEFSEPDDSGRRRMVEVPDSAFRLDCDLVFLALGFLRPVHAGLVEDLGLGLTERGNVATGLDWRTSVDRVYAAGDTARGQSLVVHAIADGRRVAREVDSFLMGTTELRPVPPRDIPDGLAE
jgi:glutamate synthase (NADPH) small chain